MSIESGNVRFCTPAECHVNRTAMRTTFALPREIKRENNDQGLLSLPNQSLIDRDPTNHREC